jgi:hypothetical protein
VLHPFLEKEAAKVLQALRQTQSRKVLFKLLTRVRITEDQGALRQLMRLRGFSVMTNVLEDYWEKDGEICVTVGLFLPVSGLFKENVVTNDYVGDGSDEELATPSAEQSRGLES